MRATSLSVVRVSPVTALVGRDDPVGACRRALERQTSLLYVHGETGVGKTALAAECARMCAEIGRAHVAVGSLDAAARAHATDPALVVLLDSNGDEASPSDAELLHRVRAIGDRGMLVVFSRRSPGLELRTNALAGGVELLRIDPLSAGDARALLERLGVASVIASQLAPRTLGLPLLITAVAAAAQELPAGVPTAELWAHALELVATQVPVMCPAEAHMLTAACAAERVALGDLASAGGAVDTLERLTQRSFVRRRGMSVSVDGAIRLAMLNSVAPTTASGPAEPLAAGHDHGDLAFDHALWGRMRLVADQAKLSPRELEVLELLLLGRNAREIGVALDISARTVRFHQSNLLDKLGADSRLDLLRTLLAPLSTVPVG